METGEGAAKAVEFALRDANLAPSDIDYINAHGTSTPLNDAAETNALKRALGETAYNIPISSTKSMTGHLLGGGAAIEAVFSIMAIREDFVPPTIHLEASDPACDLNYVPITGIEHEVKFRHVKCFRVWRAQCRGHLWRIQGQWQASSKIMIIAAH